MAFTGHAQTSATLRPRLASAAVRMHLMKETVFFAIAAFLSLSCSIASAHQDRFYVPTLIYWEITQSEHLSVSTTEEGRLREIQYSWNGNSFNVPNSEFEGVGAVDLRDIQVLGTDESSSGKYRYIKIGIGSRYCGSAPKGCVNDVRFMFGPDDYESRDIYRQVSESTTQIYRKLPGQNEQPSGQIQLLQ